MEISKPTLLIVEDDPRLAPIMGDVLGLDWDVTVVGTIAEACEALGASVFAVAVVDRRLPDGDGAEFVMWLRREGNAMPVLLLTALGEVIDKVKGLDAGANDYVVKPFEFAELNARLRALTRDYTAPARGVAIGSWTFYPHNSTIESPYTGRILLTDKEAALLDVLAAHPNMAFTRQQLLTSVSHKKEREGTVDTYVHYIRRKTDRDLIETVRGVGYRLGTPL